MSKRVNNTKGRPRNRNGAYKWHKSYRGKGRQAFLKRLRKLCNPGAR